MAVIRTPYAHKPRWVLQRPFNRTTPCLPSKPLRATFVFQTFPCMNSNFLREKQGEELPPRHPNRGPRTTNTWQRPSKQPNKDNLCHADMPTTSLDAAKVSGPLGWSICRIRIWEDWPRKAQATCKKRHKTSNIFQPDQLWISGPAVSRQCCEGQKVPQPWESFRAIFNLSGYFHFARLFLETLRKYPLN